jgi:TonB family protein
MSDQGDRPLDAAFDQPDPALRWTGAVVQSRAWWLSLSIACALHIALIACLLVSLQTSPGGGGVELDAIGVEIVSSDVLYARETGIANSAAAVAAASDPGAEAEAAASENKPPPPEKEETVKDPDPSPLDRAPVEPPPRTADADDRPEAKEPPSEARTEGGATSEGREPQHAAVVPPRSAAQVGAVNRYVMELRQRLARNRPRGLHIRGVVMVTFAVLPDGNIEYVRMAKSSGNASIDEAALSAVRHSAPFPAPPGVMTSSERVFTIPYRFE